jgi:hypothetical protein
VVNASLKHTAAMAVGRNLHAMSCHSIVNELVILRNEPIEALLNDMITVEVFDKRDNMQRESADNCYDLIVVLRISLGAVESVATIDRKGNKEIGCKFHASIKS